MMNEPNRTFYNLGGRPICYSWYMPLGVYVLGGRCSGGMCPRGKYPWIKEWSQRV